MKRKITLIIVDDEQPAIDHALAALSPFIDIIVIATFTDPVEALKFLRKNHVDFVLLDVEMPLVDGLSFAIQMPPEVKTVFCTAHRQYAVDAYDQEAVDYLLKPIQGKRFVKALKRMKEALAMEAQTQAPMKNDYYYFMIKGPIKYHRTKISFDEIVYIESRGDHTYFFLISDLRKENKRRLEQQLRQQRAKESGEAVTKAVPDKGYEGVPCVMTLQQVMEIVGGSTFMQIHRGIILNTDYFRRYGTRVVELIDLKAIKLPTGTRRSFPEFFEWIDNHNSPNN